MTQSALSASLREVLVNGGGIVALASASLVEITRKGDTDGMVMAGKSQTKVILNNDLLRP